MFSSSSEFSLAVRRRRDLPLYALGIIGAASATIGMGRPLILVLALFAVWLGAFRGGWPWLAAESARHQFVVLFIFLAWINKPQDYVHLAVLYWPLIFLAIGLAHGGLAGRSDRVRLAGAIALVPALVLVAYSGRLVANLQSMHTELVSGPRAGVYVKPGEAERYRSHL